MINLSEFKIGTKQQAGIMSVHPLLADDVDTKLATFDELKFNGTCEYGTMIFESLSEHPFIIPTGYSVITKQAAQDHALPFASLIKPNSKRTIEEACCIQQTQSGFIDGNKVKDFSILPLHIRKQHFVRYAYNNNNTLDFKEWYSFNRLWDCIYDFQKGLIESGDANLVLFFNKYMDKLMKFNAEFEVVDGQRGAIIMMNDKVVGIEVAPTQKYWKTIWNNLIRDCYGSEVLRLTLNNMINEINEFEDSGILAMLLDKCNTIEKMEKVIDFYYENERLKGKDILDSYSNKELIESVLNGDDMLFELNSYKDISYHIFNIKGTNSYGEMYKDNDRLIYLSLIC
ncbi:MAG: ARPP-1 family domain-containing protein [bacterium]